MGLFQHLSDSLQFLPNGNQQLIIFPVGRFLNQSQSQLPVSHPLQISDLLFRSGDRKTIFIEKSLDLQDEIQVLSPVEPLKGSPLMWFDDFKFRFPITKHMGFEARNAADLSDPIIKPFGGDQILIFLLFEHPDQRSSPHRDHKLKNVMSPDG
jgi:hypothetical protein